MTTQGDETSGRVSWDVTDLRPHVERMDEIVREVAGRTTSWCKQCGEPCTPTVCDCPDGCHEAGRTPSSEPTPPVSGDCPEKEAALPWPFVYPACTCGVPQIICQHEQPEEGQ